MSWEFFGDISLEMKIETTVLVWTRRFDFIQKSSSGDLRGSKTYHRDNIKESFK